jgi:hypothetical protein
MYKVAKPPFNYRKFIQKLFAISKDHCFTCAEVVNQCLVCYDTHDLPKPPSNTIHSTVSATLYAFVKSGYLVIDPNLVGPRGGNKYRYNKKQDEGKSEQALAHTLTT